MGPNLNLGNAQFTQKLNFLRFKKINFIIFKFVQYSE